MTNTNTSIKIIEAAARLRMFNRRRCIRISNGHVTTTIVVAQIPAAKNGRTIQSAAAINTPMQSTPSSVRVRSRGRSVMGVPATLRYGLVQRGP